METITKEYKVYEFDELKPEVQQEVMEKMGSRLMEDDWWDYSGILECIKEDLMEEYGILADDVYFNDRNCYLGGATIDDQKKFLIAAGAEKWMIAQHLDSSNIKWDMDLLEINITPHQGSGYNSIDIYHNGFIDQENDTRIIRDLNEEMGIDLDEFLNDILKEKFKDIRKEEEYITSEENIKEHINCNEFKFLEDGGIF